MITTDQTINDFNKERNVPNNISVYESESKTILQHKIVLITDIMNIRKMMNIVNAGTAFDELMETDIDLLYQEVIKSQDKYFEWSGNVSNFKLNS